MVDGRLRLLDPWIEVRKLLDEAEEIARKALKQQRQALDRVAAALIENETLSPEELLPLARGGAAASTG